jgi:hypothetical protein
MAFLDVSSWKTFLDKNKDIKNTGVSDKLRGVKAAREAFEKSRKPANSAAYRKKLTEFSVAAAELKMKELKRDPQQLAVKKQVDGMLQEASDTNKVLLKWESEQKPDQPTAQAAQVKAVEKDNTCFQTAKDCQARIDAHLKVMSKLKGVVLVPQRGGPPVWQTGVEPGPILDEIVASGKGLIELAEKLVKKDEKITPKDPYRDHFKRRFGIIITYCDVFKDHSHAPQLIFRTYLDLQNEFESGEIKEYFDHLYIRYKS